MDIKELWIGDKVKILSSGKLGKYEGINNEGKLRISVLDKIILTRANNIEKIVEDEVLFDIDAFLKEEKEKDKSLKPALKIKFEHTLDLHLEKLAPEMINDIPSRILDYQLERSKKFIQDAIDSHYPHITIIHGKGQGVLRDAISHQLKSFSQVRFTFSKSQGGAVEIWLI